MEKVEANAITQVQTASSILSFYFLLISGMLRLAASAMDPTEPSPTLHIVGAHMYLSFH
jgi:TRAP-type C4-dicarboxylate transport system permease small subunit